MHPDTELNRVRSSLNKEHTLVCLLVFCPGEKLALNSAAFRDAFCHGTYAGVLRFPLSGKNVCCACLSGFNVRV